MRSQSFDSWLLHEVLSSQRALVTLYETRDRLLYLEAPEIRKKYMAVFGESENAVLESELEATLLKRKLELIQAAVNRREEIDLAAIEEIISREREELLAEAERNDATLNELPRLNEQQAERIKQLYHEITGKFHPAVKTDLTDTQKELYLMAQNAYKMLDLDAMEIVYDALMASDQAGMFDVNVTIDVKPGNDSDDFDSEVSFIPIDYTLAKKLYPFFAQTEDDRIITTRLEKYKRQRDDLEKEISTIKTSFPFNAVSTLNDASKTEEYMAELRIRAKQSETKKAELEARIRQLTEGE